MHCVVRHGCPKQSPEKRVGTDTLELRGAETQVCAKRGETHNEGLCVSSFCPGEAGQDACVLLLR